MRGLFYGWRQVTHSWFKERCDASADAFRKEKRAEELESKYQVVLNAADLDKKVDALKLYMAQLQEKIKVEVIAKEKLAQTYELSLNRGVEHLNEETKTLQ